MPPTPEKPVPTPGDVWEYQLLMMELVAGTLDCLIHPRDNSDSPPTQREHRGVAMLAKVEEYLGQHRQPVDDGGD